MEKEESSKVLELASYAGHILLENGAEISRVEETMERIAGHYGVDSSSFFVLSNGIFTTAASGFAKVEFIPFKGAQLERVAEVNQLSRDIAAGLLTIDQAWDKLTSIRKKRSSSRPGQILGSAVGSAGFCIIFGGGLLDAAAAFVVGALLWAFVCFVTAPRMSKIVGNIAGSALATALCIAFHRLGFGESLGNMIIGSLIPLIPGVPFTNGIKDLANEDYLAGATRLLDALMVFLCIAVGVVAVFTIDSWLEGSMMQLLHGPGTDSFTATLPFQAIAALVGTIGFSVLFGVSRKCWLQAGICGTLGWLAYLGFYRFTPLGMTFSTVAAAMIVTILSRMSANIFKAPATVFLIPGIFPMVPGGGLFWTSYYIASDQFAPALTAGYSSVKITLAIVFGIILISELPNRFFKVRRAFPGMGRKVSGKGTRSGHEKG
ncbi:MAG: threonine/serine exporter ThrE family protein [Candidatus Cryptobacteroides sp.]